MSASGVRIRLGAADGVARFAVKRAEIDVGVGIEHDPERVGAMEYRGGRRRHERKRQFQIRAVVDKLDGDLAAVACGRAWWSVAIGRRRRGNLRQRDYGRRLRVSL